MTTAEATPSPVRPSSPSRSRRRARLLGVGATLAVVALGWLGGAGAGADYLITDTTGTAIIGLVPAVGFTLVVSLLGWLTLAVLEHVTARGTTLWAVLAGAVTLASEIPVMLVEATPVTRVALAVLHVLVGAVLIPAFVRSSRP